MSQFRLKHLIFTSTLLLHASLFSEESTTVNTDRFTLRHIESKGIGYNQGYTTLEAFFIPLNLLEGRWVPFFDARAHIFNNSRPAANIGVGARYLNSRIWGANLYYDFRQTSKLNYNQVSCGLETIGEKIDARINGYFPVGKHTSTRESTAFDYFQGNHMYLIKKEEFALQGVNAELGIHLGRSKKMDFYTAFGPYYFLNNSKQAIGGSFRISIDVKDVFKVEANTSYDSLFRWIGQGQVSLSYAFRPKSFNRLRGRKKISTSFDIRTKILQKVDKFEIIVVDTKKHKSLAINPATGQPFFFLFLDPKQAENGLGTFESPFNTLNHVEALMPLSEPVDEIASSAIMPNVGMRLSALQTQQADTITSLELPPQTETIIHIPSNLPASTPVTLIPEVINTPQMLSQREPMTIIQIPSNLSTPFISPSIIPKVDEITLVPGRGQELQTTLGTVMVPASQKGHPKITHVKDIDYQGKKTHVFVITMEEDDESVKK